MKTLKFFLVLCLVLIFAGVNAVYSNNGLTGNTKPLNRATLKYEVNITLSSGIDFCNTYLVQVSDETGRHVAHAQIFVPGINKYVFTETVSGPIKVRIATLEILSGFELLGCPINLITKPDVNMGPFFPFETYYFYLFPVAQKVVIKEN